jgi:hypothetical protein
MVLRAKHVRIEGKAADALNAAISELRAATKGLTLDRIKRILDQASTLVGAVIRQGFSLRETYANGLTNPVIQFDERVFLRTVLEEVSVQSPAIVPVFLNVDGLGHAVVVDKVFARPSGSGVLFVSLRDPATGTRHVVPWDQFADAAGSAAKKAGVILTSGGKAQQNGNRDLDA